MQLVLVTSNGPEGARTYVEAIDDLAASVRDVVDEWFELCDDQPGITLLDELERAQRPDRGDATSAVRRTAMGGAR